jgi:hypothetical protein
MKTINTSILIFLVALYGYANAGDASFEWDCNTEEDLLGYNIYWGLASGTYDNVVDVRTSPDGWDDGCTAPYDPFKTECCRYTITGLPDTLTFFAATAYDDQEEKNESEKSQEIIYGEFRAPEITSPEKNASISSLPIEFCWDDMGINSKEWWIYVGTGTEGTATKDIYDSGTIAKDDRCHTISWVPLNGDVFNIILWYRIGDKDIWYSISAVYNTLDKIVPAKVKNLRNISASGKN